VLDQSETDVTLAALRNRRAEIELWLDGPAKKATLSALGRVIAELELQNEVNAHIRHPSKSRTLQASALNDQTDER
jgi:hypothetical protein